MGRLNAQPLRTANAGGAPIAAPRTRQVCETTPMGVALARDQCSARAGRLGWVTRILDCWCGSASQSAVSRALRPYSAARSINVCGRW